ncbi:MAG: hypothetical protein V2A73_21680 [Pseudomonadota bacterium]
MRVPSGVEGTEQTCLSLFRQNVDVDPAKVGICRQTAGRVWDSVLAGVALTAVAVVVFAGAACLDRIVAPVGITRTPSFSQRFEGGPSGDVDILFVIDSSGSMGEEQDGLSVAFPTFIDSLRSLDPRSWRIGITTTDLGSFGYDLPSCYAEGDGGKLINGTIRSDCGGFAGDWLFEEEGNTNAADGDVAGAFACVARVGAGGCSFEMPLGSARMVLERGEDIGFLRPSSLLAVVVVTDEDDCTANDPSFLDPGDTTYGGATSFRCFANGVRCDDGKDPDSPGERKNCHPAGAALEEPQLLASLLRALRSGPDQHAILAIIAGPPSQIMVGTDSLGRRLLLPSCRSQFGSAVPGIRLAAAVEAMGDDGLLIPICDGDFQPALDAIGGRLAAVLRARCLNMEPADLFPDVPGLQADCAVTVAGQPVPRCQGDSVPGNCYKVREDGRCAGGYSLSVDGRDIDISCAAATESAK